jgi:hypothetical protein
MGQSEVSVLAISSRSYIPLLMCKRKSMVALQCIVSPANQTHTHTRPVTSIAQPKLTYHQIKSEFSILAPPRLDPIEHREIWMTKNELRWPSKAWRGRLPSLPRIWCTYSHGNIGIFTKGHLGVLMHNSLLCHEKYSDVKVVCGDKEWKLHKAIICPRCPFFESAFGGEVQVNIHPNLAPVSKFKPLTKATGRRSWKASSKRSRPGLLGPRSLVSLQRRYVPHQCPLIFPL